ncbi:restriction endonuclease subunit S [Clostridium taeniosporum]|uniref:Restriction endonuclease subunit S n=1 Tax=Clostridium taeniosporum TaxID=394958 RepID=A0A1D7XHS5_9CLOT|nr:restriction endonuclease subunit S [Clostridium taeniosporum]AOR22700.1 restriction endonuclease subunit S [Clostridium taeniosporum]
MDGLEAKEIKVHDLLKQNPEFRVDSEYVLKKYLIYDKIISDIPFDYIDNIAFVTDGIHESIDFDENSSINLISAKAPKENVFDLSSTGYISEVQNKLNPRTQLQEDDVIISTVGTIGNCAVVDKSVLPANSDRHVGIIRLNKNYKPRYVSTFLLSKYGRFQSERYTTGNVQPNLFIYKIKAIKIPFISDVFQDTIENKVIEAHQKLKKSKDLYLKAEEVLLNEIGMRDFQESQDKVAIKTLSQSWAITGRLDAEYYQEKYDDISNEIYNYSNGYALLGSVCNVKDSNYIPKDKITYNYIELSNIGSKGEINACTTDLGAKLPTRARRLINKGDVIVSSIEGSLTSCALITNEYDNAICSNGFYIVNSTQINSETLLLLFKSEPIQNLLKKGCSGTILTAISKDEFKRIPIPLIREEIQNSLKEMIKECSKLREESRLLLEKAKKTVEIAIEKGEEEAFKYLSI